MKRLATALPALLLIGLLAGTAPVAAQEAAPITIGHTVTLHSDVMGEDRPVLISTPNGYAQSTERFPVLYLLDGDAHFHHTTGLIDFLSRNQLMPQMLVVAVPNTNRTRDLTPTTADTTTFPTAGGADTFLRFITDELVPYVEANYRTQPYRALVGHSFGGLFAVHALLTHPEAFDAYVSISPSLWWDDNRLLREADTFLDAHADLDGFLYMTMGNEGGNMLAGAWGLAGLLETKAPETFDWEFALMEEETHGSIPHRTTYAALEALYADWQIQDFGGLARDGGLDAFDAHYVGLSEKFGYEIETPELLINQLGYFYLGQEQHDEAIAVLAENVARFPESANVYDSLGDGYDAQGETEKARANYAKAVEKAAAQQHPNLGVYRSNLERVTQKLSEM